MQESASIPLLVIFVGLLSACSIRQDVQPVSSQSEDAICLIEDPAVRAGFLETYKRTLQARGYQVRVIPKGSALDACPLTSTYIGRWTWDLAIYLVEARIEVFRDGRRVGQAEYNARSGGANMKKFVKGEKKVAELVEQLFPARAEAQAPAPSPTETSTVTAQ